MDGKVTFGTYGDTFGTSGRCQLFGHGVVCWDSDLLPNAGFQTGKMADWEVGVTVDGSCWSVRLDASPCPERHRNAGFQTGKVADWEVGVTAEGS